jgi:hypothetical protein
MKWNRSVSVRGRRVAAATAATIAFALAVLAAPAAAEGLPVIDFISQGGVVSEEYVLNVTVIGDVAPGQVFYGLDGADPTSAMTARPLYHYEAVIDTSGMSEGDHTITVKAVNGTGDNVTRSQTITVDHTDPAVTITSSVPEYVIGEYTVTATVDDANVDPAGVRLVVDGNMSLSWSMEDQGSHFELVLDTATELMCGPHVLSAYAIDLGGNGAWSDDQEVAVDNCKPMVTFTSEGGHVSGIYQLSVNVTDAYMDPGKVWAFFDGDMLNKTALDDQGDGVYTYSFDTTNMADGDTEISVLATDLVGFSREAGPLVLMVDNNAPTSVITSGGGNVSGVVTIEATVTDAYLNETAVYLVVDGDDDNSTMMTPVDGKGRYELLIDTEEWMDGNRELRVWAEDAWGMSARSPAVYMDIDNHEPAIRFVSGGGTRWGTYQVRANVTDPNLNRSCVKVKVAGGEPMQMKEREEYWYLDINTRNYPDGALELMVMACDHKGHMNMGVMMMITVANQADLEIVVVEWASTDMEVGDMARVKVSVRNNGHTTVKDYDVVASSGGSELASMTESTGIQPGKVHTYTLEWKAKSAGDKYVRLEVDPGDAVTESDETNNHYEQQLIKVTEGGSGVPGMGALLALAAVVVGSLALLDRRER